MAGNPPQPPSVTPSIGGDQQFPSDLQNYQFYIAFDFRKWRRRSIRDRAFFSAQGNVRLPIPINMIDNNQVEWGIEGNNPIAGALLDIAAARGIGDSSQPQTFSSFFDKLGTVESGDLKEAGVGVGAKVLQNLTSRENINQTAGLFGMAINPFLTIVFQNPLYKRHSFSWRLSPTNRDETESLRTIVNKFRFHMMPSKTDWAGGVLLNYPDIVLVTLYPKDSYLYKFKPCVVTDAVIGYSPNQPAFFDQSKAPAELILTVNLLEVEYWLKEDVEATWDKDSTPNSVFDPSTNGNNPTGSPF